MRLSITRRKRHSRKQGISDYADKNNDTKISTLESAPGAGNQQVETIPNSVPLNDPNSVEGSSELKKRKFSIRWVPTDQERLQKTESKVLSGLNYYQATIAGLNTISTEDIRHLDDANIEKRTPTREPASSVDEMPSVADSDHLGTLSDPKNSFPSTFSDGDEGTGVSSEEKDILILVHGFAGGVGGWAQNWNFFAQRYKVYAFDLPGFGRSERRKFKVSTLDEAMNIICDYFRRWMDAFSFSKPVILLGHSFGAYICSFYTLRHPQQVKLLTMVDPWGANEADPKAVRKLPFSTRFLLYMFYAKSPLALLRGTGPAGPVLMKRARPDFRKRWEEYLSDADIMYDYLYHCNALQPPTGEHLFKACCHHDIAAKRPMSEFLPQTLSTDIPVGFLFGEVSTVNSRQCREMADRMSLLGFTVLVDTVRDAGHQVFTDNVKDFNLQMHNLIQSLIEMS